TKPIARIDAEELAAAAPDAAVAELHRIGADATPQGRATYAPGDRHALFANVPPGPGAVCVAAGVASNAPVTCVRFDLPAVSTVATGAAGADEIAPVAVELE
ncbi:MAG: hypothetical protein KIT31_35590, partial [Deltaproteobacteria bacterium]|nr:hypothetical protein [Deltaproteobacteria bacterium]